MSGIISFLLPYSLLNSVKLCCSSEGTLIIRYVNCTMHLQNSQYMTRLQSWLNSAKEIKHVCTLEIYISTGLNRLYFMVM